jgi:methanogenic corrinoid protein MtbC1
VAAGEGDKGLSISAVSLMLGIPVPTIRSWERRYGIPTPDRTGGSHRRYGLASMNELRELRDEIAAGRRARDAAEVIRRRALEKAPGSDHVTEILDAALEFDAETITESLDRAHATLGLETTIQSVVLPVMREVGAMWEAGRCDVANEHLASQEVRTWLSRHAHITPEARARLPVVLACGPNDVHSLGLEAFHVLLARRGWKCRVLGSQTPTLSLLKAIGSSNAAAAVVTSHMNTNRRTAVESIRAVANMSGVKVFYAGNAFVSRRSRQGVPGHYLGDDLTGAADLLEGTLAS